VSALAGGRLFYLAGAVGVALAALAFVIIARRRQRLGRLGFVTVALGSAPLVYEGLAHAEIIGEKFLRFGRPEALILTVVAGALLGWRLSRLPTRMSGPRRFLVTALTSVALLAATLAVAEPELGKRLDRLTVIVAVDRSRSIDLVPGAGPRVAMELRVVE
jgi:Ca-activated chloride channel homolog